jgi:hypothetical protein
LSAVKPSSKDRGSLVGDFDFRRVYGSTWTELQRVTDGLVARDLPPSEWLNDFNRALRTGHTDSWRVGRLWGRDPGQLLDTDILNGRRIADQESNFLLGFLEDIEGGRYTDDDGNLNAAAIKARSRLYAGALRGTAYEGWTEEGYDGEEYDWILGPTESHCSDCPQLASLGPYQKETLFVWPGRGTECLGNCDCTLVRRSDGMTGPRPIK